MAYGNDAWLALTTHTLLRANRLASPIEAVTAPGFRQYSCSETPFGGDLVTTAVQHTLTSLIDPADAGFLGTVRWLPDRTIIAYVSRLHAMPTTQALCRQRDSHCTSHAPLVPQFLPFFLCPGGKVSAVLLQSTVRRRHAGTRARGVHRR
jgi:hypothetical protein